MKKIIYQLDSFTEEKFGGNPAAIVLDAENLKVEDMKKIAREMNLSETAFVSEANTKDFDYNVRFFTPTEEVDLCGHATIAVFYLLAKLGYIKSYNETVVIKQKTLAGILPVELKFNKGQIENVIMTQGKPEKKFEVKDLKSIADILKIGAEEIGLSKYPDLIPMAYSTGLPDIILPVKDLEVLRKIKPDFNKLKEYSITNQVVGVHSFTIKDYEKGVVACRNFAPAYGIDEEAATGTSNGALGAYLYENSILDINQNNLLICEQGIFMNRPSKIYVKIEKDRENVIIKVGGKAVIFMEGVIYI